MQTRARKGAWIVGLGLALVSLFSLGVYVTYSAFTSQNPGANDFYSRWVGGCALLREGVNPYSETVTVRIQEGMYGRPALPDEDQVAFAYPLYSLIFFFPLCLIDNYALVQAIWFWLLLGVLAATAVLWMRVIRWRPQTWLWALTLLWVVLMYHSFRALILGQFAVFVLLTLVAALWALKQGHDGWAGVFLALSTIKPQMVYLAIPWILLWSAGRRRWRLWAGFGVAVASLVLGSVLLLPSWIHDFLQQVLTYPSYTVYGSLTWMIVQNWLKLGHSAEIAVSIVLFFFLLTLAWRLWHAGWEQMLWMLGLVVLMTNFLTPRIATTNYLLLVPWALWGFYVLQARLGQKGTWAVAIVEIASAIGLWLLFATTVQGNFEQAPVYFPFPALLMLLLAWLWGQLPMTPDARSSHL